VYSNALGKRTWEHQAGIAKDREGWRGPRLEGAKTGGGLLVEPLKTYTFSELLTTPHPTKFSRTENPNRRDRRDVPIKLSAQRSGC
jgi:hypothetical protein